MPRIISDELLEAEQSLFQIESITKTIAGLEFDAMQISRFGRDGNRIVLMTIEAFHKPEEAQWIVDTLNKAIQTEGHYSAEFADA